MKKIKLILGSIVLAMGLTSCESWLDVNQDPDNPTAESATPDIRLPWIQNYFTYAWGSASMRTSQIYGVLTQTSTTSANGFQPGEAAEAEADQAGAGVRQAEFCRKLS